MPWPVAPSFLPTPEPPPLSLSPPRSEAHAPLASVKGAAELLPQGDGVDLGRHGRYTVGIRLFFH